MKAHMLGLVGAGLVGLALSATPVRAQGAVAPAAGGPPPEFKVKMEEFQKKRVELRGKINKAEIDLLKGNKELQAKLQDVQKQLEELQKKRAEVIDQASPEIATMRKEMVVLETEAKAAMDAMKKQAPRAKPAGK